MHRIGTAKSKTSCPDKFIYDFLGAIQNEWHYKNCSTKAKSFKNKKLQKKERLIKSFLLALSILLS
tara:strand:- start:137 stop:334 length:198 start_codon:yes stop_codon:yes gene_type:complete